MAYNGSGVFNRLYSWVQDRINAINIDSTRMDAEHDGFATGLSTAICKDGQTTITADLPMSGFKHTNVGNASARTQYISVGQVQDSATTYVAAGGTGDAITLALSPAITAYAAGQRFVFKASAANTGAATINVNSVGAKDLKKLGTTALAANDIVTDQIVVGYYDGTAVQVLL